MTIAGSADAQSFGLGEELSADGCFVRQESVFRRWVTVDGSSGFLAAAGRYHLYACLCCPWSQRAVIGRLLKGLEDVISLSYVDPYRDARGWAFSGGDFVDHANGFSFLSEAYSATDATFDDRLTLPVLWEEACANVFAVLDQLEERLAGSRYLVGDTPTEADWRLFPTCVRFDSVYYSHFKCNLRRLVDYPNLWAYTRDLYQQPRIAETVDMAQIKRHYYTTHDMINPSRIIPAGPVLDFLAPHNRG